MEPRTVVIPDRMGYRCHGVVGVKQTRGGDTHPERSREIPEGAAGGFPDQSSGVILAVPQHPGEPGEIGMGGVVQSLEDGYVTVTLTRDVECNGNFFPEGSDLRFPIDEPIQEKLALEDIQVGDLVGGCFLSDTVEAGDPPTVWVVSFGLENWTMTGELLDYSEDFFLVKPLYPDWVVQEAEEVYVSRTGTHYGTDVEDPAVGMYLSFDCARDLHPRRPRPGHRLPLGAGDESPFGRRRIQHFRNGDPFGTGFYHRFPLRGHPV